MRKVTCFVVLVAVTVLLATGCSRVAKEAVGTVRGAKGIYAPIRPVAAAKSARPLGQYTRFELGRLEDDFGGKVPPSLFGHLPGKFAEQLRKAKLPNNPGGKTLLIRGRILHYEDAGMVGMVVGPLEEVVARIELVDKATGRVIGVGNCIGRTKTATNKGVAKKAEGLAKAIVSWLKARYPKSPG